MVGFLPGLSKHLWVFRILVPYVGALRNQLTASVQLMLSQAF